MSFKTLFYNIHTAAIKLDFKLKIGFNDEHN